MCDRSYICAFATTNLKGHIRKSNVGDFKVINNHLSAFDFNLFTSSCVFVEAFTLALDRRKQGWFLLDISNKSSCGMLYILLQSTLWGQTEERLLSRGHRKEWLHQDKSCQYRSYQSLLDLEFAWFFSCTNKQ